MIELYSRRHDMNQISMNKKVDIVKQIITELKFYHVVFLFNIYQEYTVCISSGNSKSLKHRHRYKSTSATNLDFVTKSDLSESWSKDMQCCCEHTQHIYEHDLITVSSFSTLYTTV